MHIRWLSISFIRGGTSPDVIRLINVVEFFLHMLKCSSSRIRSLPSLTRTSYGSLGTLGYTSWDLPRYRTPNASGSDLPSWMLLNSRFLKVHYIPHISGSTNQNHFLPAETSRSCGRCEWCSLGPAHDFSALVSKRTHFSSPITVGWKRTFLYIVRARFHICLCAFPSPSSSFPRPLNYSVTCFVFANHLRLAMPAIPHLRAFLIVFRVLCLRYLTHHLWISHFTLSLGCNFIYIFLLKQLVSSNDNKKLILSADASYLM